MTTLEKIKKLKEDYDTAVKNIGTEFFIESFAPIWEKYPTLKSFNFCAYTPYFNDGDVCTYSVHNDEYSINLEFQNGNSYKPYENFENCIISKDIEKLAQDIPDDIYQSVLGDHITITVTPTEIILEDYDHD